VISLFVTGLGLIRQSLITIYNTQKNDSLLKVNKFISHPTRAQNAVVTVQVSHACDTILETGPTAPQQAREANCWQRMTNLDSAQC
jgi:hypothetical protein